jgi:cation diffusion facilitator family transporter
VVLSAIGVAAGWPQADPVVGLLITVAILYVLRDAATQVWRRLMDAVDPELLDRAESVLAQSPGVERVSRLHLRWVGHVLIGEATIEVDDALTLREAHDIAEQAEHRLLHELPRLHRVTIHTDPGAHDHAHTAHHS